MPMERLIELCRPIDVALILGGREPTMRTDLSKLIYSLKQQGNTIMLLTNGIRLSNAGYLSELRDAGLDKVILSISSLREAFYERMEGHRHLKRKLEALENLARAEVPVTVSSTISLGENDDELGALWQLCLDYSAVVNGFRLRTTAEIGRSISVSRIHMSDLLGRVAEAMGISKAALMQGYDRSRHYHTSFQFMAETHLCETGGPPVLDNVTADPWWNRIGKEMDSDTSLAMGDRTIALHLFSWPDRTNLDLDEQCNVAHMSENQGVLPFFEALIGNENDTIL